jgi:cold shock CspA family protein
MAETDGKLTRIGIFYDGNFFLHVSNYYHYNHERRARISIGGLHAFLRHHVAKLEGNEVRYCQIADAHYFRGRLRAAEAEDQNMLYKERVFDDILMREGVTTHYLPLTRDGEKGIDVWLALEAFELAVYKRYSVTVLVACDGDFLPLVRKLNTLGTRVLVLGWDFKYLDSNGMERETRTAKVLLDEATYPVLMNTIIDDRTRQNDPLLENLFVARKEPSVVVSAPTAPTAPPTPPRPIPAPMPMPAPVFASSPVAASAPAPAYIDAGPTGPLVSGTIQNLKSGYGFITPDAGGPNMFFFHADVIDGDFLELRIGDRVAYAIGQNDRGPCARQVRRVPLGWSPETAGNDAPVSPRRLGDVPATLAPVSTAPSPATQTATAAPAAEA